MFLIGRIKYCARAQVPSKLTAAKKASFSGAWVQNSSGDSGHSKDYITHFPDRWREDFLVAKRGAQ